MFICLNNNPQDGTTTAILTMECMPSFITIIIKNNKLNYIRRFIDFASWAWPSLRVLAEGRVASLYQDLFCCNGDCSPIGLQRSSGAHYHPISG